MICLVLPLLIGFGIDCVLGDPHSLPHPVVLIGKTISWSASCGGFSPKRRAASARRARCCG